MEAPACICELPPSDPMPIGETAARLMGGPHTTHPSLWLIGMFIKTWRPVTFCPERRTFTHGRDHFKGATTNSCSILEFVGARHESEMGTSFNWVSLEKVLKEVKKGKENTS